MKNITNSLMPLAALVLVGTCLVSVFGLLVVLMTSVGFADGLPLFYFQRLNVWFSSPRFCSGFQENPQKQPN